MQSFLRHAMRDGFFHADMHPGNLFVDDQGRIVAVDFGIMGQPVHRPVDHLAAAHPTGADHQRRRRQRVEQPGQLLRRVRAVGVHLHDRVVVVLGGPGEPGDVRRAEALLARPVQDVHLRVGGGELVGDARRCRPGCCRRRSSMSTAGTAARTRSTMIAGRCPPRCTSGSRRGRGPRPVALRRRALLSHVLLLVVARVCSVGSCSFGLPAGRRGQPHAAPARQRRADQHVLGDSAEPGASVRPEPRRSSRSTTALGIEPVAS